MPKRLGPVSVLDGLRTLPVLVISIFALVACSESVTLSEADGDVYGGPAGATISLVNEDGQEGEVASYLSNPVAVQVRSKDGVPMPGIAVEWTFSEGGGVTPGVTTGSAESRWLSFTDGAGRASASWLLGTRAGMQNGSVKIIAAPPTGAQTTGNNGGGGSARATGFVANGKPAKPIDLSISPTDHVLSPGQSVSLNAEVMDSYGNPVSDPNIQWRSSNRSVATVDDQGTVTSAGAGYARITAKSGPLEGYANIAVVSISAGALHKIRGDEQFGTVGEALPVRPTIQALNGSGDPVEGVEVRWSVRRGGGSVSAATGVTDASGEVSVDWTMGGTSENQILDVAADGLPTVSFEATAAYPVTSIAISPTESELSPGGSAQLTATARDQFGSVVENVRFDWSSSSTAVATISSTGLLRAVAVGNATITARAEGLSVTHRATVTAVQEEARDLIRSNGSGQTARVGQTLPTWPAVRVVDRNGNGVAGVGVSWQVVTGRGQVSSANTTTDGNGSSSVSWTLGERAGPQELAATVANVGSVSFDAEALAGPIATLEVWPGSSSLTEGESLQLSVNARDQYGNPIADPSVSWSSNSTGIARVTQSGRIDAVAPGSTTIRASAGNASDQHQVTVLAELPTPTGEFNEPDGFEPVIVEEWNSFDKYDWWHTPTNEGTTEIVNGRLVWTYPEGKKGGSVPGAKVEQESLRHGPYQYHRDEGVTISSNFHGHQSGVNKFRYFPNDRGDARSPVGFYGSNDSELTIGVNSAWFGPNYDKRLRWNSPENLASPTREQARFTRGVPHTVETLVYVGTPGNADGWLKLWLDGVLILHIEDLGMTPSGLRPLLRGVHIAPVWGGIGDIVPATQTLTVERTYVSTNR